jgi:hypothetical protein
VLALRSWQRDETLPKLLNIPRDPSLVHIRPYAVWA